MSRQSGWRSVRNVALTVALVCGLGATLATAEAQAPADGTEVTAPADPTAAPADPAATPADPAVAPADPAVAPADPVVAAGVEVVEPETPSPWSIGLVTSTIAVAIGAISSVLGIWVHRNDDRPLFNAIAMSTLVIAAATVGIVQGYLDAASGIGHTEDLERMLGMVDEIALESGDPALAELVKSEGKPSVAPAGGS